MNTVSETPIPIPRKKNAINQGNYLEVYMYKKYKYIRMYCNYLYKNMIGLVSVILLPKQMVQNL